MFEKSTPASDRARRNMRAPITLLAAMLVLVGCTAKKSTPPPAATTAIATATEASGAETTTPTTGGPAPSALSAVTRREPLKMTDPGDGRPPITLFIDRTVDQTTVNGTVAAPSGGGRFGVSVAAAPAFMKGSGYIGKDGRLWHDLSQKSSGQGKTTDQSYPNGDHRITDPDESTKTWPTTVRSTCRSGHVRSALRRPITGFHPHVGCLRRREDDAATPHAPVQLRVTRQRGRCCTRFGPVPTRRR